jgi:hypothetical protein
MKAPAANNDRCFNWTMLAAVNARNVMSLNPRFTPATKRNRDSSETTGFETHGPY